MNFKEFFQQINEDAEHVYGSSYNNWPLKKDRVNYDDVDARAFVIIDDSILFATTPEKFHGGLLNQFFTFHKVYPSFQYTDGINNLTMDYGGIKVPVFMKGKPPPTLLNDNTIINRRIFLTKTKGIMGRVWIQNNICSFWCNIEDLNSVNWGQIQEAMQFYKIDPKEVFYEVGDKDLFSFAELDLRLNGNKSASVASKPQEWQKKLHMVTPDLKGNMMKMMGYQPKPARDIRSRYAMGEATTFKQFFQERAFHGTPHKIPDKFDVAKVGSGEGANAYGWGLYFAEERQVAKTYTKATPSQYREKLRFFRGEELKPGTPGYHAASLIDGGRSIKTVRNEVKRWIRETPQERTKEREHFDQVLNYLNNAESKRDFKKADPKGNLYEVTINIQPSELLLWDEPLEQQPQIVKEYMREHIFKKLKRPASMSLANGIIKRAIQMDSSGSPESTAIMIDNNKTLAAQAKHYLRTQMSQEKVEQFLEDGDSIGFYIVNQYLDYVYYLTNNDVGEWLYGKLKEQEGTPQKASLFLLSLGIKGIRYNDGFSRHSEKDIDKTTFNYVIFDQSLIHITKENGQYILPKNIDEKDDLQLGDKTVHITQPNQ